MNGHTVPEPDVFDIVFVGHTYRDRIVHEGHPPFIAPGGSLFYGAVAAARIGMRVGVVTKLAEADRGLLSEMERAGVACMVVPSPVTSEFEVVYAAHGAEDRAIFQRRCAPGFAFSEMPRLKAGYVHLAGNAYGEFPVELVPALKDAGHRLALDMQGFVRQPREGRHRIEFRDVPGKRDIVRCLDALKLDALEARILTDEEEPLKAIEVLHGWGCREVVLTQSSGILCRSERETLFAAFANRNSLGRNGRGDTTFAAYLSRRLTHSAADAAAFAAALVSIKLERVGAFSGTLEEVLERMDEIAVVPA